jgi:hypothetical protein
MSVQSSGGWSQLKLIQAIGITSRGQHILPQTAGRCFGSWALLLPGPGVIPCSRIVMLAVTERPKTVTMKAGQPRRLPDAKLAVLHILSFFYRAPETSTGCIALGLQAA